MNENDYTSKYNEFIFECEDDYVGLWSILKSLKISDIKRSKNIPTLKKIIYNSITYDGVIAGQYSDENFIKWNLSAAEILEKIFLDWSELGELPDIGDIVWFTKGESYRF